MNNIWILAEAGDDVVSKPGQAIPTGNEQSVQETGTKTDGGNGVKEPQPPLTPSQQLMKWAPMIIIMIIMYMFIFRGPKKKQQKHAQMVKSLKKNDRVRTIGGIFATVIEVRDKEVVIKIDESNNTKMRVSPSAISTVMGDEKE
jgi:preprotein translocase subunit YajC